MDSQPMGQTTILVVEDDARVASVIADQLRAENYDVVMAWNAREAAARLREHAPDAVVLDVMLPDGSGFDLCRHIRCGGEEWDASVGILVLTARVEEADLLRGFERGADDYLRKPFSMPELVARIRALVARKRRTVVGLLQVGGLVIDVPARRVSYREQPLDLAAKEFHLLVELASEPGAVRTKQELLRRVW